MGACQLWARRVRRSVRTVRARCPWNPSVAPPQAFPASTVQLSAETSIYLITHRVEVVLCALINVHDRRPMHTYRPHQLLPAHRGKTRRTDAAVADAADVVGPLTLVLVQARPSVRGRSGVPPARHFACVQVEKHSEGVRAAEGKACVSWSARKAKVQCEVRVPKPTVTRQKKEVKCE